MALTMKDAGLVSGVPQKDTPLTAIKALRGFFNEDGKPAKPGEIVLCSERFARGIISTGKAERAVVPAPEPQPPASEPTVLANEVTPAEPAEEPAPKKTRRGRRHTEE